MEKQYFSCAETAKLVRQTLKEAFPGVKFSVRSDTYAGGASIRIGYKDGPAYNQVKAVVSNFEGSYFDGMTDYKGLNYSSLDGKEVRFGADFIFVNRTMSQPFLTGIVSQVVNKYGLDNEVVITEGEYSGAYIKSIGPNADSDKRGFCTMDIQRLINEAASEYSEVETQPSATAARVGFLGDDGYGYGAVGRIEVAA